MRNANTSAVSWRKPVRTALTALALTAFASFFMPGGPDAHLQAQSTTIVLWTANVPSGNVHGDWTRVSDSTAAGGAALRNPDRGRSRVRPALASPTDYFEIAFNASAGTPYYLWIRMKADGNSSANDSVHVQFNRSVDGSGRAIARIGTSGSMEPVLQDGSGGAAPSGWGWTSNGWDSPPTPVYFSASGQQIIRIQRREDGPTIDQIVLSPGTYTTNAPGTRRGDTRILASTDGTTALTAAAPTSATRVIWTSALASSQRYGDWARVSDSSAAGSAALHNPNRNRSKVAPALSNPANFFEATFEAEAGRSYHVWIRGRADSDSTSNDSVHLQFNDSLTTSGSSFARIGTSSSMEFVLQAGPGGSRPLGWGWTDNGWGSLGAHIRFATTGTHRVRIQQREDGIRVDQIVISPDSYLTTPPGARRSDTTILPASSTSTSNQAPTVSLTSPSNGASFTAPATINMTASASDPEGRLARVEFFNGSTRLGTDTTSPFTYSWGNVAAGSYSLRAIAFDADGGQASSATISVSVSSSTNQLPSVTLTSPVNGATFSAGATIAMAASASDPEGRMARVEFYNGSTRLGTDTTAPYTFSWAGVAAGSYTLRAIAFDQDGGQRASANVSVTVGSVSTRSWIVVFGASSNHATAVTSYRVEVFASGANPDTATPVRTSDLGKPTPNSNNEISVDRSTFFNGLSAGTYGVVVRAIGSGGTARSNLYSVTR